jgi:hypothetical protein
MNSCVDDVDVGLEHLTRWVAFVGGGNTEKPFDIVVMHAIAIRKRKETSRVGMIFL